MVELQFEQTCTVEFAVVCEHCGEALQANWEVGDCGEITVAVGQCNNPHCIHGTPDTAEQAERKAT